MSASTKPAELLPNAARHALMQAAKTPDTPPGRRQREIERVIAQIRAKYPNHFRNED